jgi:hypothetical protein
MIQIILFVGLSVLSLVIICLVDLMEVIIERFN